MHECVVQGPWLHFSVVKRQKITTVGSELPENITFQGKRQKKKVPWAVVYQNDGLRWISPEAARFALNFHRQGLKESLCCIESGSPEGKVKVTSVKICVKLLVLVLFRFTVQLDSEGFES